MAVVEAGGFSAAQNELNVGLAAISKQISDLEIRIGMRLCTRGREGFALTEEGKWVYQASIELFTSVDSFRDKLSSAQNELIGDLSVGVIDNTVSDVNSPLIAALGKLHSHSPKIRLRLHASQLDEVERGVVDGRLIVGILILTGRFLGFLPEHYAAPLVREGRLRALCPERVHLSTAFNLILRHNAPRSPLVKAFATALGVDLKATTIF